MGETGGAGAAGIGVGGRGGGPRRRARGASLAHLGPGARPNLDFRGAVPGRGWGRSRGRGGAPADVRDPPREARAAALPVGSPGRRDRAGRAGHVLGGGPAQRSAGPAGGPGPSGGRAGTEPGPSRR